MPPELLLLLSRTGSVTLKVKFPGAQGKVADIHMRPGEITKFVCPDDEGFLRRICIDDHYCEIIRYEIDPIKNIVVIRVRNRDLDADGNDEDGFIPSQ